MRTSPGLKFWTLLLIIGVHAWLGWTLANFHPERLDQVMRPRTTVQPDEVLMVLQFETRAEPAESAPAVRPTRRQPRSRLARPGPGPAIDSGRVAGAMDFDPGKPLNLQAPPPTEARFERRGVLERPPQALAFQSTRYDGAWMSDGNLTEVVARRSKVAGALLAAMGALRKPCTEKQMAQYDPGCVTDQYRHPDPGE